MRKSFFTRFLSLILLSVQIVLVPGCVSPKSGTALAERNGWKLAIQSYTFRLVTVAQAIDKTAELGVKYIEIYPGHKLGTPFGDGVFNHELKEPARKAILDYARSKGVKIIACGVYVPKTEEWNAVFSFARDMGMEYLSAEPAKKDWRLVEELAKKYNIKVACHNHPSQTSYWKPEILLNEIKGRSPLLGSSADIGHYKRMGLDPIDAIRQLQGRLISMHFKDLAPEGEKQSLEDVVWGKGVLNIKAIMQELKRQDFKGYFTIEYEADWENNVPQIRESIQYFDEVSKEIW